ncbi:YHYH domain-containing protein [Rahnella bruchi]
MKKLLAIIFVTVFGLMSLSVSACPKGEHPHGGTGSHHKGGYCE